MKHTLRIFVAVVATLSFACGENKSSVDSAQKTQENPTIALQIQRPMIAEGDKAVVGISVNRTFPANKNLVWEVIDGFKRVDSSSGSLILSAGTTGVLLELSSTNNSRYDGEGGIRLRVRDADGVLAAAEISIGIIDDDPIPFIGVLDQEGVRGSRLDLALELSAPSNLETQVTWRTVDATAKAGIDYEATNGVAIIPPGETRSIVSVVTLPLASDSNFVVKLVSAQNAVLADSSATAHILPGNNLDTKVTFASASTVANEGSGQANIEVRLSNPVGLDIVVDLSLEGDATTGSDFAAIPLQVTIPAGQMSVILPIQIVNDQAFEREEILRLRMKSSINASFGIQTVHALFIQDDDDAPMISVSDAQVGEGRALSFAVSLAQVSGAETTFSYQTVIDSASLYDFAATAGTVTIPKGQTLARVNVQTSPDTIFETSESLQFVISEANGATLLRSAAQGTIIDDDQAPTVEFVSSRQVIPSNQSKVQVQVRLNTASGAQTSLPFHIGGSAVEGVDHNLAAGVITIPPGKTTGEINFEVVRHGPPPKTVVITLDPPSGAVLGSRIEHTVEF